MKVLKFRVPERLAAEIDAEARARGLSRSAAVRERLQWVPTKNTLEPLAVGRDLAGSATERWLSSRGV